MIDTIDKLVSSYFAAVCTEPFTYKRKTYYPKRLQLSPSIFTKRMNCVADCGACCHKFSLDWLVNEEVPESDVVRVVRRSVTINDQVRPVWTDWQNDIEGHHCHNLGEHARCQVHGQHPFSCDFELLRFSHFKDPKRTNYFNHRPYGRAWNMKKQDGERGALCEWYTSTDGPMSEAMVTWQIDTIRRLMRLRNWVSNWRIPHCVDEMIDYVRTGPHKEPFIVGVDHVRMPDANAT